MRKQPENVAINPEYLAKLVKETGLSQKQFSRKIGQVESFIGNAVYRRFMRRSAAELLCEMFDADWDKLTDTGRREKSAKKVMMADDKSIEALANCMVRIEAKLDTILDALS